MLVKEGKMLIRIIMRGIILLGLVLIFTVIIREPNTPSDDAKNQPPNHYWLLIQPKQPGAAPVVVSYTHHQLRISPIRHQSNH
jgi:hypothetical protein